MVNKLTDGCGCSIRIVENEMFNCNKRELCSCCKARIEGYNLAKKEELEFLNWAMKRMLEETKRNVDSVNFIEGFSFKFKKRIDAISTEISDGGKE